MIEGFDSETSKFIFILASQASPAPSVLEEIIFTWPVYSRKMLTYHLSGISG